MQEQVKDVRIGVLTFFAFATNKGAIHVYEMVGFARTDPISKKDSEGGDLHR
jgi:hypothetical protein